MKIKEIKTKEDSCNYYLILFKPNWLEKLFGLKEKVLEVRDIGATLTYGGGHVYDCKDGSRLDPSISKAVDKFRRAW